MGLFSKDKAPLLARRGVVDGKKQNYLVRYECADGSKCDGAGFTRSPGGVCAGCRKRKRLWRRGSRDDVAAFDQAVRALWDNSAREARSGVREETAEYHRLNDRVNRLAAPLGPVQRSALATGVRLDRAKKRRKVRSR